MTGGERAAFGPLFSFGPDEEAGEDIKERCPEGASFP